MPWLATEVRLQTKQHWQYPIGVLWYKYVDVSVSEVHQERPTGREHVPAGQRYDNMDKIQPRRCLRKLINYILGFKILMLRTQKNLEALVYNLSL